jgi:4-amino-4-deoxy-L-arabinose transferase-like glycosyltransferase
MAVAPTQLHMSRHALVDGFFTFWALLTLWLLWENLRAPRRIGWIAAYAISLCLLVLTKENAFFVYVALLAILLFNHWLRFGTVTRELLVATVVGPLLGVVALVFLAGGIETLRMTYQLSVSKNYHLEYAILTGDGPWHRYLVDLLLASPVVLLLAIGAAFRLDRTQKPELFVGLFIAASFLVMCNLKYGMNLRYANMWDLPLRLLALSQIVALSGFFGARYRTLLVALGVLAICAFEFRQWIVLCVQYPLYELVTEGLLRALHILKTH